MDTTLPAPTDERRPARTSRADVLKAALGAMETITIGKFELTPTGFKVKGTPSWDEYMGIGDFIKKCASESRWWLAAWVAYGEKRAEWRERMDQAVVMTGLARRTLENIRAVHRSVPEENRNPHVEFGMHEAVAALPVAEQREWLERAETEGMNRGELRKAIRQTKRRKVLEGTAILEGQYRVWYIDPAWGAYRDSQPSGSNAEDHYDHGSLSYAELMKLPFAAHALKQSVAFIWVPAPLLYDNPGPREVIEAWGWEPKQQLIWHKERGSGGHYTHGNHELLIIATRGDGMTPVEQPDSVIKAPKGEHSAKPAIFRKIIQKMYPQGPYAEGFAREQVEGWSCYGTDLGVRL